MIDLLMWKESRRLILFVLAIVAAFVYIGNAIPQIKSGPVNLVIEIGESSEELIAAGKKIFSSDRSQCLTCHSLGEDPKARCPDQEGLGERAAKQRPGMSAAEYIVESIYNPNAYIVSGYPKNQMTPVHKPPIALSDDEILATIAFLNSLGGETDEDFIDEVKKTQDPWKKGLLKPEIFEERAKLAILPGDPDRGREVYEKAECDKCHIIMGKGRDVCPDLTTIGASQSAQYLLESIIDPNEVIVKGYKQVTVIWKEEESNDFADEEESDVWEEEQDGEDLQGVPTAWIPDKKHPLTLRLSVDKGGEREEQEVDLGKVACVGDTVVAVEVDGEFTRYCGDYVSGDEKKGVTLLLLENGGWEKRHIGPEGIQFVNFPMSPMPENFAEIMTPREVYDLLAYLMAQKGGK